MYIARIPQLSPDLFEPSNEEATVFHGPTLQIMGTLFHTSAFAVDNDPEKLQPTLDPELEDKYSALQEFYSGRYETVRIRDRDCVLIIHPFTD